MKSSNYYPHSEGHLAIRDTSHIGYDLGMKMKPRPSGSHEFFASCVKTKTDAVVESEFENFSEKSTLVVESDSSEAGNEDTKLVAMEVVWGC